MFHVSLPHPPKKYHVARNAVVVFVAALIGYSLTLQSWFKGQISLIDYQHGSLPPLQVPDPTSEICSVNNPSLLLSSPAILCVPLPSQVLGIGIIMGPLISFLESIAIAKAFGKFVTLSCIHAYILQNFSSTEWL